MKTAPALSQWDRFWFQAPDVPRLFMLRWFVCLVLALYYLAIMTNADYWWTESGWHSAQLSRKLAVASEGVWSARFRLSPLWLTSSPWIIQLWCALGILWGLLALAHSAARIALCLSAVWLLCLVQRSTWSTGPLEPWLLAMLGYLAIYDWDDIQSWPQSLSQRLIQVHLWLLIAAALVSQLSYTTWWRGESAWWLASTDHSTLLNTQWLTNRILLVNAITHAITVAAAVAAYGLWPLVPDSGVLRKRIGVGGAMVLAFAYALVADQVLYGVLIGAASLVSWPATGSYSTQSAQSS